MTKLEIFDDIIKVVKNDASFCKDKSGADFDGYRHSIHENMSQKNFELIVNLYLASFGVPGHLFFYTKNQLKYIGFEVARHNDDLYVVNSDINEIQVGDKITEIDCMSILQCESKFRELLYGEIAERQGQFWDKIISYCNKLKFVRNNKEYDYKIKTIKNVNRRVNGFKMIEGIGYLRLDDFFDENLVPKLLADSAIYDCERVIIDVRKNGGGTDLAWIPLLELCLSDGEVPFTEDIDEINYSPRNVDIRLDMYKEFIANSSPESKAYFDRQIADLKSNRGKGFVRRYDPFDFELKPVLALPKKVYILTDCTCASSGESFVAAVKGMKKVTVIGRRTMGINNYSNLAYIDYGDYVLGYPTTRSLNMNNGIDVDVYVPWTRESIFCDSVLAAALNMDK